MILSRTKESLIANAVVVSEYKGFSLIKEYLLELKVSIYKSHNSISRLINKLVRILKTKGRKSKKNGKKISIEIVEYTKLKKVGLTEKPT